MIMKQQATHSLGHGSVLAMRLERNWFLWGLSTIVLFLLTFRIPLFCWKEDIPVWRVMSFLGVFFGHIDDGLFNGDLIVMGLLIPAALICSYVIAGWALHFVLVLVVNIVKSSVQRRSQCAEQSPGE